MKVGRYRKHCRIINSRIKFDYWAICSRNSGPTPSEGPYPALNS